MKGIGGYQPNLMYQDGLYGGLMVKASTGLNVRVGEGLAIVGNVLTEQTPTGALVDILLPANSTVYMYANKPNALDSTGATIATFDYKKEGDQSHVNINGTTGTAFGRSIVLAKVVTSANSGTITLAGTPASTETITVVIDGTSVVTTLTVGTAASLTTAAAAVAAAINANATVAAKVVATSAAAVVTITAITSGTVSAYTLTTSETMASGTSTASGATLAGAAVSTVDNTERIKISNIPGAQWSQNLNA